MKVPVKIRKIEEDGSGEFLGSFLDLEMFIDAKIDFPVDGILIKPGMGKRMTNFEIASMLAANKLTRLTNVRHFEHMKDMESVLAKYIRDAFIEALDEMSANGRHPFYAFIDRPKGYKAKGEPIEIENHQEIIKKNKDFEAEMAQAPIDETIMDDESHIKAVVIDKPKVIPTEKNIQEEIATTVEIPSPISGKTFTVTNVSKATIKVGKRPLVKMNVPGRTKITGSENVNSIISGSTRSASSKRLG